MPSQKKSKIEGTCQPTAQNYSEGQLVGINRFERRIISCSNPYRVQEVYQICLPRPDISVQGAPLRVINSTQGVYKDTSTNYSTVTPEMYTTMPVPGRYIDSSEVSGQNEICNREYITDLTTGWVYNQCQQISLDKDTAIAIYGDEYRYNGSESLSPNAESTGVTEMCTVDVACRGVQNSPSLFEVTGFDGSGYADSPTSQTLYPADTNIKSISMLSGRDRVWV